MIKIKYKKLLYGGGVKYVTRTFHDKEESEKCIELMKKDKRYYDIGYVTKEGI